MKCPYCGGPIEIRENAVEQIEYRCPYCDGIVKVESNEPKTRYGTIRKMGKDYLDYRQKDREAKRKAELEQQKQNNTELKLIVGLIALMFIVMLIGVLVSEGHV